MTAGAATLNITCREHGLIFSGMVVCHHDVTYALERVGVAHSAKYGAACTSTLDVAVPDDGNVLEQWSRYPGVAPS